MELPEELLGVARSLADLDAGEPRQASLRRAVSTAYYALFHLLVTEAAANWSRPELRSRIGRLFDHGLMLTASNRLIGAVNEKLKTASDAHADFSIEKRLQRVAIIFVQIHEKREEADYDNSREWSRTQVWELINRVAGAFEDWNAVRETPETQAYLVSLLVRKGR
jgi:hypothetical protein